MFKRVVFWISGGAGLALSGCGGPPPASPPTSATTAEPAPPPAPTPAEPSEPVADVDPDPSPEPPPPPAEPADPPPSAAVAEACEKLCVKVDGQCSAEASKRCRGQCGQYLERSAGCEDHYVKALSCQTDAADGNVCVNVVAASCGAAFRAMQRCADGAAPAEATGRTASDVADWQLVTDAERGFTVLMPAGAALDSGSARHVWRGEQDGITYSAAVLPPPPSKLTQQVLVKMVVDYVTFRCQRGLKLHGRFDSRGQTGVRYDTACSDGTQWRGMLRIWNGKAITTAVHSPAGAQGVLEPFFYSFKLAE